MACIVAQVGIFRSSRRDAPGEGSGLRNPDACSRPTAVFALTVARLRPLRGAGHSCVRQGHVRCESQNGFDGASSVPMGFHAGSAKKDTTVPPARDRG
jgi:hypothetical protein